MSVTNSSDPTYVLGRPRSETERLQQQGQLFEPYTRRLIEAAGITTGMIEQRQSTRRFSHDNV